MTTTFNNDERQFLEAQLGRNQSRLTILERQREQKGLNVTQQLILARKVDAHSEYQTELTKQKDATGILPQVALSPADIATLNNILIAVNDNTDPTEFIRSLTGQKHKLNARDEKGMTLLMHAAKAGKANAVDALLEAGANPTIFDKEGHNALFYAAIEGNVVIARTLSTRCNVNHKYTDTGNTAAHLLVEWTNSVNHKLVLEGLETTEVDIYTGNSLPPIELVINQAATLGAPHIGARAEDGYSTRQDMTATTIRHLSDNGLALDTANYDGRSALSIATQRGLRHLSKELACIMKAKGFSLDGTANTGETALFEAVSHNLPDLVKALLSAGAHSDIFCAGNATPLQRALYNIQHFGVAAKSAAGDLDKAAELGEAKAKAMQIFRILLGDQESDAVNVSDSSGHTAFTFALSCGFIELAYMIANHPQFNIYQVGPHNQSVIQWPIVASLDPVNREASLQLLGEILRKDAALGGALARELDIDEYNMTSLAWVAKNPNYILSILDMLIRAGEDPNFVSTETVCVNIEAVGFMRTEALGTPDGKIPVTKNILAFAIEGLMANLGNPANLTLQNDKAERIVFSDKFNAGFHDAKGYNALHWLAGNPLAAKMIHVIASRNPALVNELDLFGKSPLEYALDYWVKTKAVNQDLAKGFAADIIELVEHGAKVKDTWRAIDGLQPILDGSHAAHEAFVARLGEIPVYHDLELAA